MKFNAIVLTLLLALVSLPAGAQERSFDLTGFVTLADMQGDTKLGDVFETDLGEADGYGISANMFLTNRFSVELAAFRMEGDAEMVLPGVSTYSLGTFDLTPITAGVQFHPLVGSRFDPYIGAGAAYVMADDLESAELDALGVGAVELDSEITYYANVGLGFNLFRNVAVVVDGRYVAYEPTSTSAVTGAEEDLDLTSLMYSAGLRFRF